MIFSKRIDKKLLTLFLCLAIIPLGIMAFISYTTGIQTVKQQTYENLSLVANAIRSHTHTFINSQRNIAKDFSSDKQVIESLKIYEESVIDFLAVQNDLEQHILLNKLPLYSPFLLDVAILNHEGKVIFSTNAERIGKDESEENYFKRVRNEGYFGDVHMSSVYNEPLFEVSAPVVDQVSSTFLGIVVNKVSATTLADITRSSWLEEYGISERDAMGSYFYGKELKKVLKHKEADSSGDVYIVNKNKCIITLPKGFNDGVLEHKIDTLPVQKAFTDGEEMVGVYKDYRGTSIIGASIFINELNWLVLIEKEVSRTFAALFKLKAQMITFGIVILGIIILVSSTFSKKFTAPIKLLLEATKRQSAGDANYRAQKISEDEFGELVISFNKMCDDIRKITISRNFFERILIGMSDSVIITDLNFRIKRVNPITLKLLGYEEEELIGNSFFSLIFEGGVLVNLRTLIKQGSVYIAKNQNATYKTKDGHGVSVNFSSFFTKDCKHKLHIDDCTLLRKSKNCANCEEISVVNIAHNITQHKRTEAQLSKAKEAAEYSASVRSEFLANMSHEIRTPLNAILGMSEVLQEQIYGPLNEKQLKSLSSIDIGGRHLLALITDILDVSKIEAGKLTMEFGTVSVKAVCEASLLFIRQMAKKKGIKVKKSLDEAVPSIQSDEKRLKQILVNLLSNAVKFTNEGGLINLEVIGKADKQLIYFIVSDDGVGIEEDQIDKLFQPFTQLKNKKVSNQAGTGLGLALVKQMAELHGGRVSVESEVGKGSKFIVALPWKSNRSTKTISEKELESRTFSVGQKNDDKLNKVERSTVIIGDPDNFIKNKKPLVLIADDNEDNIIVFSEYLNAKGFKIEIAHDGLEAIEMAKELRPDIILMDVQMPGINGIEATRRIRADVDLENITIIAVTASAVPGIKESCLKAGVDEYMTKPVGLKELVETIKTKLNV